VAEASGKATSEDEAKFGKPAYVDTLKELAKTIREHVGNVLGIPETSRTGDISVDHFLAAEGDGPTAMLAAVDGGGLGEGIGGIVSQWGTPALLGVIALVSLFLVASMVKRAAPAPLVIRERVMEESADEDVAGEADQLDGVLQGIEVDEDTLRVNGMVEQVNEMITENPETATALVRRWLNEE
jgi:flagellar biosynthesis/type III secretory pathway M-ring protein FliF/YscJ